MPETTDCVIIFITCANLDEAIKISNKLLDSKLVACTNTIKEVYSSFWWKGKIEKAEEILLTAKTVTKNFDEIALEVKKLHSYSVPEIIAMPITAGNPDYLKWIEESTK